MVRIESRSEVLALLKRWEFITSSAKTRTLEEEEKHVYSPPLGSIKNH
jgi:hypothetical protein